MKNLPELIYSKIFSNHSCLRTYGLEYFATDHCNLRCYGCSQCSPFLDKNFSDVAVFKNSLEILKKYLQPQKITILGGEPLLHPDIDSIVAIAQSSGMFEEVHITTNGMRIFDMSPTFWRNIDSLIISKHRVNSLYIEEKIDDIKKMCKDNNVELEVRDIKNFNYITLSEQNKNKKCISEIYGRCTYKYFCHTLSGDRLYRCSPVVNYSKYFTKRKIDSYIDRDYLKIEDSKHFRNDLMRYLNSKKPLVGCAFCLGTSGKSFPQRQLSKLEIENPDTYHITVETSYDLQ